MIEVTMIMEGQVACTAWISSFGDPADVLEVIDLPEPEAPGPCEALLGMELAPVNRNDLL